MNDTLHEPQLPDAVAPEATPDVNGADEPDPLNALGLERDEAVDRALRLAAEFDNYRKRIDRERRELSEHLAAEILTDFLPVLDDLERALAATTNNDDAAIASHRQGLELIHRQFSDLLRRRHVMPIDTEGADFDPARHQAVGQEVSEAHREGAIIEELRRGYTLGDRLLRASMVRVATRG